MRKIISKIIIGGKNMPKFNLFKGLKDDDTQGCSTCGCGEFMTEFAQENPTYDDYVSKGVTLNSDGSSLNINYDGLLAKSGASHVYAVVSYGDNENWDNVRYYRMESTGRYSFKAVLPINDNTNLNIAFKDCANNWDNNSGKNYSFISH